MSMNRTDALTQLAQGLRKFEGWTASEVLAAEWPGLHGLDLADLGFFRSRGGLPVQDVARSCLGRGHAAPNGDPPLPARRGRPVGTTLPPEQRKDEMIRLRVTQAQRAAYAALGGDDWLRLVLDSHAAGKRA